MQSKLGAIVSEDSGSGSVSLPFVCTEGGVLGSVSDLGVTKTGEARTCCQRLTGGWFLW